MSTHPMSAEESLVQQASAIRAANKDLMPGQKVFVYRDPVIAYPWYDAACPQPARSPAPAPPCRLHTCCLLAAPPASAATLSSARTL